MDLSTSRSSTTHSYSLQEWYQNHCNTDTLSYDVTTVTFNHYNEHVHHKWHFPQVRRHILTQTKPLYLTTLAGRRRESSWTSWQRHLRVRVSRSAWATSWRAPCWRASESTACPCQCRRPGDQTCSTVHSACRFYTITLSTLTDLFSYTSLPSSSLSVSLASPSFPPSPVLCKTLKAAHACGAYENNGLKNVWCK